jgi:hypothetical protein
MPASKGIPIPKRVAERVLAKVEPGENGCVLSTYSVASHGYAQVGWQDSGGTMRGTTAHRAAWTAVHGPIPDDMTVHHQCHNRRCVNVEHMELLSNENNARRNRDGLDWERDGRCAQGHGPEHWVQVSTGDGYRRHRCVACQREARRKYEQANPEKVRETKRKYEEANPDKRRESNRKWRAANRESYNAQQREYRARKHTS